MHYDPRLGTQFLIQLTRGGFVIAGVPYGHDMAEENFERVFIHKNEG
jgi:hypothetical protein